MSITSGFFNSLNGDRRYNAEQMGAIFDGVINDGVFASIGTTFAVSANGGLEILVGVGRAWFNSTWVLNDAVLPITLEAAEVLLNRWDAVVIEIDRGESVRAGSIKIVYGEPASTPQKPVLESSQYVHQYPLAYIYRKAESTEITQADITNMIGTSSCPYVTAILQVTNLDHVFAQWQAQFEYWSETTEAEYREWHASLKSILDGDVALNLANLIAEVDGSKVERAGDTMTGPLTFKSLENGESRVYKDHDASSDNGLQIVDVDVNGQTVRLAVQASDQTLYLIANGEKYKIYSERDIPELKPNYTYGTEDLIPGETLLKEGQVHYVYE